MQEPDLLGGMLEASENDRWHPLESLLKITTEQFRSISASMSPLLKVNAIAAEFPVEYITWNVSNHIAYNGFHLILSWSETCELCI
jgi:hypothetical protein